MAPPGWALHRHRYAQKCAEVRNRAIQFLEVHIQRLAVRAARLFVESDPLYVETFEDGFVENLSRALYVLDVHIEFDSANKIRNEPVEPYQVFIPQETLDRKSTRL